MHVFASLCRIEELEVALGAAARVNRLLNEELDAALAQLRAAQAERDAWRQVSGVCAVQVQVHVVQVPALIARCLVRWMRSAARI